jgi:hypothetical protein
MEDQELKYQSTSTSNFHATSSTTNINNHTVIIVQILLKPTITYYNVPIVILGKAAKQEYIKEICRTMIDLHTSPETTRVLSQYISAWLNQIKPPMLCELVPDASRHLQKGSGRTEPIRMG